LVRVGIVFATLAGAALSVPYPAAAQSCAGDCGGDGVVSVDDLVRAVNVALNLQPIANCGAADPGGDGRVSIDELIRAVGSALRGCDATPTETPSPSPPVVTATPSATGSPVATAFCDLPGSVQSTAPGLMVVPGGPAGASDLTFIRLPIGFCVHHYGTVGNVRQLRFAPGGELFAASPTQFTSSNGPGGKAAIVVLPDDDRDGTADGALTFKSGLQATVGLLFTGGYLYYQDSDPATRKQVGTKIMRMPYVAGDRTPSGSSEEVADFKFYASPIHWPKTLDVADDGTIYATNGGDEGEACREPIPFHGGILKLGESLQGTPVARGFRNPIALRCVRGYNLCFALELSKDFSNAHGGREKLLPIRNGDDWGYPCCATRNQPFTDIDVTPDCSAVAAEIDSFSVGHTPFDLDYELGRWPEPWGKRAYVLVHGTYGIWEGARIVGIGLDTMTGDVLPGSDLPGVDPGAMIDFATGWGEGPHEEVLLHGRPTVVAFAPDGRLFMGNDQTGEIIWIAPLGLRP
jgi:glucose/arabinose dehydrogenase